MPSRRRAAGPQRLPKGIPARLPLPAQEYTQDLEEVPARAEGA
jgi:hypothetical protein